MASNRRPRPANATPERRLPLVPILVGAVIVLAAVALIASLGGDDEGDTTVEAGVEQTRPVTVTGDALPPLSEGDDPSAGAPAPEIEGASFDGSPLAVTDDGTAKVLVFLAHWCPHCQREVPVIVDWLQDHGRPEGVDLYAIATSTDSERPNFPPSAWLEDEGLDIPTLADDADGTAADAFGLTAFPYFVAIGDDGRVVARGSGELGEEQLDALVDLARLGG